MTHGVPENWKGLAQEYADMTNRVTTLEAENSALRASRDRERAHKQKIRAALVDLAGTYKAVIPAELLEDEPEETPHE